MLFNAMPDPATLDLRHPFTRWTSVQHRLNPAGEGLCWPIAEVLRSGARVAPRGPDVAQPIRAADAGAGDRHALAIISATARTVVGEPEPMSTTRVAGCSNAAMNAEMTSST